VSKLTKTDVNFWLDALLLVVFSVQCWLSVVVRFVFPKAVESAGWTLWGWDYQRWSDAQFAVLCLLAVAGKLRHRTGAAASAAKDDGSRTLWGVGLMIVVFNAVAFGVAAALLTIRPPGLSP
jgi:hypothetical protein